MPETYTKVKKGFTFYYKDPEMKILHRTDGPAIEHEKGFEESWYLDGVPHRDGGPAFTIKKRKGVRGYSCWYKHGLQHRDDGPAEITEFSESYYKDGFLHREDGPAIKRDGSEEWCLNGERHRKDGPAIVYYNEEQLNRWFLEGEEYMKLNESEIVEFNGVKFMKCLGDY
jgi:hypothetical protein